MTTQNDKLLREFAKKQRRNEVARAYLTVTRSPIGICRHLGYSDSMAVTVKQDIHAIQEDWKQSAIRDFELAREESIKLLEKVQEESWDGWRRSQTDGEQSKVSETKDPSGGSGKKSSSMKIKETVTSLMKEKRDGNPQFLRLVLDCQKQKDELMGLTSLGKDDLSSAPPLQGIRIIALPPRQDDRIGTGIKQLPSPISIEETKTDTLSTVPNTNGGSIDVYKRAEIPGT